jgi:hypothetical protein
VVFAKCLLLWCRRADSNRGPTDYEIVALLQKWAEIWTIWSQQVRPLPAVFRGFLAEGPNGCGKLPPD